MICRRKLIVIPETAEGEGFRRFGSVHIEGDRKFRADFRFDAEQGENRRIRRGFVCAFFRQASFNRL